MKTKIFSVFFFALTFSCALYFTSCKRSNPCDGVDLSTVTTTYNVSDANKAKIPYTGTDTLVFLSDAGDTATLYGQGKKQSYTSSSIAGGSADCPKTHLYQYENIDINYTGNKSLLYQLRFKAYKYSQIQNPLTNDIDISVNNVLVASNDFEYVNYNISTPQDSIVFNGNYQSGVFIDEISKTVLFNYTLGILKLKDSKNKVWTKIK